MNGVARRETDRFSETILFFRKQLLLENRVTHGDTMIVTIQLKYNALFSNYSIESLTRSRNQRSKA